MAKQARILVKYALHRLPLRWDIVVLEWEEMCGRVSAQMRKLNQPIGAIQRNTKLMEPAD